ncbi:hypothetical protein KC19_5G070800 [Ceratodon purpureus]|uniref:ARID domain-containing protein n=1 Tax=Ceratodon purpureus TaxID=3225 RepID=A0A8T0I051_CERPU|nr:hypothetical protein KC19_5G070800 [Ceratodon purpureus]
MLRNTTAGLPRVTSSSRVVRTLLAVICGKHGTTNGSADQGVEINYMEPGHRLLERPVNGYDLSVSRNDGSPVLSDYEDLKKTGCLEVHILEDPSKEELGRKLEKLRPDILMLHGERNLKRDEVGDLVLRDGKAITSECFSAYLSAKVPELIYLETSGLRLAELLHSQSVPHVMYWQGAPSSSLATHFRRALLATLRSSATGGRDAFQIASASFLMHCGQTKSASINDHEKSASVAPMLLAVPVAKSSEDGSDDSSGEENGNEPTTSEVAPVQIYDEDINIRLLVCCEASRPTAAWVGAIEDGLSALLTIEAKGARLLHRISAPPPPMAATSLFRGVVTMRCDICTSSFARVPLLVSGAAQTCFDDQLLENSVKKQLLDRCEHIQVVVEGESQKAALNLDLRRSVSVACGASIVELKIKAPTWVGQVLRQLAAETSHRGLVAMGIAGVEGAPVAAFQEEDAAHLVSLKRSWDDAGDNEDLNNFLAMPSWLAPPAPSRKRLRVLPVVKSNDNLAEEDKKPSKDYINGGASSSKQGNIALLAAMKPIPHTGRRKFMPFANAVMAAQHAGWSMKLDVSNRVDRRRQRRPESARPRSTSFMPGQIGGAAGSFLPPPIVKPHCCNRPHMEQCTEEEFLPDLISFLETRGHGRLIPPAGADAFPEVVLNGKRLDLYNLYKEVVSRGGFHVGNGINWKGQVFAKMRNHTSVNKMTGVGNTLKKHYEVYLLEYELAHDDVDGECCILCHSGAEGDWVNCGICGEWAHFGCDQRSGLGAFKEYAKTDGLEYICPRCSAGNGKPHTRRAKPKSSPETSNSPPTDFAIKTHKRS